MYLHIYIYIQINTYVYIHMYIYVKRYIGLTMSCDNNRCPIALLKSSSAVLYMRSLWFSADGDSAAET